MSTAAEFALLSIDQLHESQKNPRRSFNATALAELTESVKEHGVITPLLVRPNAAGYEIAAGHRRYRAAKAAGLNQVPALVRPMTDLQFLEVLQIENLLREDVHPLEEAEGYRQLLDAGGYDVARIAERVGKSVKYVYDRMKLLSLTTPAQQLFFDNKITAGHAILLARLTPADQASAIGDPKHEGVGGGLFQAEVLLWDPTDDQDCTTPVKPRSVRELQAWIDTHVKFDAAAADPMLFPDTVGVVTIAKEQAERVVSITYDNVVHPDARDGQRVLGPRSWKRADGTGKDKRCDHAVTGVLVVGPGRGEAFKVCIAKEKCATHWAVEQKERKARAAGAAKQGKSGEERWQIEERTRKEQQARDEAAAVKKAPTKATGLLGQILLEAVVQRWNTTRKDVASYVPLGTSAEDLVRHAVFTVLRAEIGHAWTAPRDFPKRAKAFGVDVKTILDAEAPVPTAAPGASGSAAKKKRTAKEARK